MCKYQDRVRADVHEFIHDKATINGLYFTSRACISFNGVKSSCFALYINIYVFTVCWTENK